MRAKKSIWRFLLVVAGLILLLALLSPVAGAQSRKGRVFGPRFEPKKPELPDSAALARRDSLHRADSLHREDSLALLSKSSLELPAFSQARDSIVEIFSNGQRKILYYGDVSVKYQDMGITSEFMEYDMNTGTVYACGVYDSLAGEWKGRPVLTQAGKTYNIEEVRYNFNSRKARITNVITQEDDAILHGRNVKLMPDNSINITKGKYTVCDAENPHYYLKLSSAKVMTKPTQKTVFGPANMVVEDVNLPFIGLPFGFIPKRPKRATGLLMPTFGEETARGFYMRDAGMYFVFGDYLDLSVTGSLYTMGSWGIDVNSRYLLKYKFTGNLSVNYSVDKTGEKGTPDYQEQSNFGVKWSHQQDSKAHPGTSFSASVNFSSPSNSRYNSHSVTEALQSQTSSSISYSRNWNGKFNLSVNALHSQNTRDSSYAITLPNITFGVSTFYPFKRKHRVGKERFYEKISFGYNTTFQNKINFKAREFMKDGFWDKMQNGMQHNFSIGLPSFTLLKYLNFNPSISYGMNWFFRSTEYKYNPETDQLEKIDSGLFKDFGITQTYSGSISMNTRIYGTFNFGKFRRVQAIRHIISPSVSISYSPEKGTAFNGYRTLEYTTVTGEHKTYEYNRYEGQLGGVPGKGQSASMTINIGNNFEAKVRDYADTTGKGSKKVKLIDQLNFSTGCNFLADSLKWNPISMNISTTLFNAVGIQGSLSLDPYAIGPGGRRINKAAVMMGQGLVRMTSASVSASYSISGKGHINGNDGSRNPAGGDSGGGSGGGVQTTGTQDYYQRIFYHPVTGEFIPGGWVYYTNPNVPWSVNLSYSFRVSRSYGFDNETQKMTVKNTFSNTLNLSGNIKLTPKLSLNATTGFDFVAMKMTTTQISATYDLHCFNISVSWVPTGTWQSYSFRIAANAAALADILRFKKSSSFWDN